MHKIIISLLIMGLSFGSGPCLASCGPILISYISGRKNNIAEALRVYFIFSLSRICVYIIFSALVFFLGSLAMESFFGNFSRYLIISGGIFICGIGILMILGNKMESGLCRNLQNKFLERDKKSIMLMGLVMGIAPCAPFLAVLSYVGLIAKTWFQSLLYGLAFGLGTLISPLILLTAFSGLLQRWIGSRQLVFGRVFNALCALIIIFLGLQLIFKGAHYNA